MQQKTLLCQQITDSHKLKDQEGVTLLLAIMVLGALVSIVLSIAAIAFNEVRTSSDITKSEPAITAAEAAAEDDLFMIVRNRGAYSTDCSAAGVDKYTYGNGVKITSCANLYYNNPYADTLPAGATQAYFLYNPSSPTLNPGYTGLSVTMASGTGSVTVDFCNWSTDPCTSAPGPDYSQTLSVGQTWVSPALNPTSQYQLYLVSASSGNAVLDITTTTSSGNYGLPIGTTTIQTTGSNGGVTRKIQTNLPQ